MLGVWILAALKPDKTPSTTVWFVEESKTVVVASGPTVSITAAVVSVKSLISAAVVGVTLVTTSTGLLKAILVKTETSSVVIVFTTSAVEGVIVDTASASDGVKSLNTLWVVGVIVETTATKLGFTRADIASEVEVIDPTTVTVFKVTSDTAEVNPGVISFITLSVAGVKLVIASTEEVVRALTTLALWKAIEVTAFEVVWAIDDITETGDTLDTKLALLVVEVILDTTLVLVWLKPVSTVLGVTAKEVTTGVVNWFILLITFALPRFKLLTRFTELVVKADIALVVVVTILACCKTDVGTIETPRLCITLTVEKSLTATTEEFSPKPGREISLIWLPLLFKKFCKLLLHLQLHLFLWHLGQI